MKITISKTAAAFGLFTSGLVAGYTVSRICPPLNDQITLLRNTAKHLFNIKIIPAIPELDAETTFTELDLDLAMDE